MAPATPPGERLERPDFRSPSRRKRSVHGRSSPGLGSPVTPRSSLLLATPGSPSGSVLPEECELRSTYRNYAALSPKSRSAGSRVVLRSSLGDSGGGGGTPRTISGGVVQQRYSMRTLGSVSVLTGGRSAADTQARLELRQAQIQRMARANELADQHGLPRGRLYAMLEEFLRFAGADGVLTSKELLTLMYVALPKSGIAAASTAVLVFERMDRDEDSRITFEEYIGGLVEILTEAARRIQSLARGHAVRRSLGRARRQVSAPSAGRTVRRTFTAAPNIASFTRKSIVAMRDTDEAERKVAAAEAALS